MSADGLSTPQGGAEMAREQKPRFSNPSARLVAALLAIAIIVASMALGAGCSSAPVITVRNESPITISNVVVSGSGFTHHIGSIPPKSQRRLAVRPSGESGVRLTFEAGTKRIDSGSQGYVEARGRYRITVTVDPNFRVSVAEAFR